MMKQERWQQIKELFEAAQLRTPHDRAQFLAAACQSDESLRREVESLIDHLDQADTFLQQPAVNEVAEQIVGATNQLASGARISHYEIIRQLGVGGMGEVYLAQDTKLQRRVALKLLPGKLAADKEAGRRFLREARAAAALEHPSICAIHEIGEADGYSFIVMQYIEGETLAAQLKRERLSLCTSLDLAKQIADALAEAHEHNLIHRDIKPANVMITPRGQAKVLDFGLAKFTTGKPLAESAATTLSLLSMPGLVMGTVPYMSPEQVRGEELDARSDIFSFGVLLYEVLSGQQPFTRNSQAETISAILSYEPPFNKLVGEHAEALQAIVCRCLAKDKATRYQTTKELLFDLQKLQGKVATLAEVSANISPRVWKRVALATLVVGLLVLTVSLVWLAKQGIPKAEKVEINRSLQLTTWSGLDFYPAFSRDGNTVAFSSDRAGSFEIYVKQLGAGAEEVQLTADGGQNVEPAISPAGNLVAYYSQKRGGIWVIPITGGNARQLTEFGSHPAWSPDGSQLAFQSAPGIITDFNAANAQPPSTLWLISAAGGEPKQLTQAGNPVGGHGAPAWSPDGKRIVFDASDFSTTIGVWSVSKQGDDLKRISGKIRGASDAVYATDGKSIYFVTDGGTAVQNVKVSATGEPIAEPVKIFNATGSSIRQIAIAGNSKRLVYAALSTSGNVWLTNLSPTGKRTNNPPLQLTQGKNTRTPGPVFSPDGKKIAYVLFNVGISYQIWVMDVDGGHKNQLTDNGSQPTWFPDGKQIGYKADGGYWSVMVEGGKKRKLLDFGGDVGVARLSPDGKQVAFHSNRSGTRNIWLMPIEGGQPRQLTFDKEAAGFPAWSPDGKWIAFEISRSGGEQTAVIPSTGGEPTQLTFDKEGGFLSVWSPDNDNILYAGRRDNIWNVYSVSRSTKEVKQWTNFTKPNSYVRFPAYSPLKDKIAYEYAETTGNIWLIELK